MFERYTEKAHRALFFARLEARRTGSRFIQPEHLLLGLIREDPELLLEFLTQEQIDTAQKETEAKLGSGEPLPASEDLPLSDTAKRALAYAAEESQRMDRSLLLKKIEPGHLLVGLLREENTAAADLLRRQGLDAITVQRKISAS